MNQRDHKLYIDDMINSMEKTEKYIEGLDQKGFSSNDQVFDAVISGILK